MAKRRLSQEEINNILFASDSDSDENDFADSDDPDFQIEKNDISSDSSEDNAEEQQALQLDHSDEEIQENQHGLPPSPTSRVLWFQVGTQFAPRLLVPDESLPVILIDANRKATEFDIFEKLFPSYWIRLFNLLISVLKFWNIKQKNQL